MSIPAEVRAAPTRRWLEDAEQAEVIGHHEGVLLVIGAPGSGKTATVVRHVQRRILDDGLPPDACLALAPTRQAAARLRTAIGRGLGKTFAEPLARTPSSLAFAVLRLAAASAGEPLPRLLSGAEQDVILRELLAGHHEQGTGPQWPPHLEAALPTAGFRAQLRDLLMRAVEHGLEPHDLIRLAYEHGRPEWVAAAAVLEEYDQVTALSEPGSFDPAWICTAAADQLEDDPVLLDTVRARLRLVVVDDAQELTASAARLVRVLSARGVPVLLVGDPDVTVLGFRGAVPGLFVELAQDLHGDGPVRTVTLRTRYRGSTDLVHASARVAERIGVVHGTAHRRPFTLAASAADTGPEPIGRAAGDRPPADPGRVEVAVTRSYAQEAAFVTQWIREAHLLGGVPWDEIAVIARSGGQQETLRRTLTAGGVPVRADRSGTPLGQDPAVTPLLVAFDVVTRSSEEEWELSGDEAATLLTSALGGVDPVQLRRLRRWARTQELTAGGSRTADEVLAALVLDDDLALTAAPDLPTGLAPVVRVGTVLRSGRARFVGTSPGSAEDILWALWEASGLARLWESQALGGGALGARADRDLDSVLVLFGAAATYVERLPGRSARSFLAHVRSAEVAADTLVVGARAGSAVEVLTPQAAAGRQWRLVAVVGVQEGVWPDLRLRDTLLGAEALVAAVRGQAVAGAEAVRSAQAQVRADELRQFHLALSRPSQRLLVTAVASTAEQPSGFLDLIDPGHRGRPAVEVPPPLTLRGLVGQLRREAVLGQRESRFAARDAAIETLLVLAAAEVAGAHPQRWWDVRDVSTQRDLVESGPVRVSPSRLQTYLDCPLRWFLTSRGADTGGADTAQIGTLVHDIVAEQPEATEVALAAEVDRRWPELGLRPSWVADKQQTRAQDMIRRYVGYVREAASEGRELVGTELELRARILSDEADLPSVDLVGRVDRLERDAEGRLVILDLKTSKSKPTKDEIDTHAQLGSYQVAVEAGAFDSVAPDARSGGAQLINLGTAGGSITQAQPPVAAAQDPRWAHRMLLQAGAEMAGHRFDAKDLGRRCRTCPARFSCPLQPEGQGR